jgi:hypothetical protein
MNVIQIRDVKINLSQTLSEVLVVKATLMVALLYFVSPIAIANLETKAADREAPRLEFFQPHHENSLNLAASQSLPTEKKESVKTLCSGEGFTNQPVGSFCASYVPEPIMTLNDLESTGMYACEPTLHSDSQPELFLENALILSDSEKVYLDQVSN